jgi:hypothetical protein
MSADTKDQFLIIIKIVSSDLSPLGPDPGPLSSICLSYILPLAEDRGHRLSSLKLMLRVEGGCLRGRASHARGSPCLQAPRIHAAVVEEDPRHSRSRRRTHMAG